MPFPGYCVHIKPVPDGYTVGLSLDNDPIGVRDGDLRFPYHSGTVRAEYPGCAWFETHGAAFMFALGVQAGLTVADGTCEFTDDGE